MGELDEVLVSGWAGDPTTQTRIPEYHHSAERRMPMKLEAEAVDGVGDDVVCGGVQCAARCAVYSVWYSVFGVRCSVC